MNDFEIDRFFGEIASIRMDINDYTNWCNSYIKIRSTYPQWKTKDGTMINIGDMSDNHLNNTIALVERADPENNWVKALRQEKTYRKYKSKLNSLKEQLAQMEYVVDTVF